MVSAIIAKIEKEQMKQDNVPEFSIGDSVRVHVNIREGDKERVQVFAGTVIARDGTGATETFTVRRISYGVGVERVFPLHSPRIRDIAVESRGRVRRAKLYYLRDLTGKKARLKERVRKK